MKCRSCGEEIREDARFCGFCGAAQMIAEEAQTVVEEPVSEVPAFVPGETAPETIMEEAPLTEIPELEVAAPAESRTEAEVVAEPDPVVEPAAEPVLEAAPEMIPEPAPEPAPEPVVAPAQPVAVAEPVAVPQPAPVAEPVAAPQPVPVVPVQPAPVAQPVYQAPQPQYQPPQPVYQAPQPQYQPPQPVYQAPQPQYQPPQPVYQAPQPQYQPPQPVYQAPQPQYQPPQPVYQAPQPQYQPPRPAYQAPQYQPKPAAQKRPAFQLPTGRGLGKMFWLGLLTFGIYPMVIMSRIPEEMNMVASRYDGQRTQQYYWMLVLTSLTFGIYPIIWTHNLCNRMGNELRRRNIMYQFDASTFWLWNVLGSLILVGPFIYTHKMMKAMNLINLNYNEKG